MATAFINSNMLYWARERSGTALSEFAAKMGQTPEKILQWESGAKPITFNQAMKFAEKTYVPFGYFFLRSPPAEELPIPDLRTLDGKGVNHPSGELIDLLKLMQACQSWYREHVVEDGAETCAYVGRCTDRDSVETIVSDMRQCLEVGLHPARGTWDEYFRNLIRKIEALGILVMRQSYLGHHTRALKVDEFRGFAMMDPYSPLIFVNTADAPGAKLFTLIHELCHVWIGKSGISDGSPKNQNKEEILCNAVAAEFLVPEQEFIPLWDETLDDWRNNLPILESYFHVSSWTIARRALTFNFISQAQYTQYVLDEKEAYANRERRDSGRPSPYRLKASQLSNRFAKALTADALNGRILLREASSLLGVKPSGIKKFAEELGL